MKNQFLLLEQLSSELWNENKAFTHQHMSKPEARRQLKRLAKLVKQIRELKLEDEIALLYELYQLKEDNESNTGTGTAHG